MNPTKRVLVIYYSQSGEVAHAAKSFVRYFDSPQIETVFEHIKPKTPYPYPWKSAYQFFDIFPECLNQEPPEIYPPSFDHNERFDLVILVYQVWFLAPSLPIQGFLKSEYARVLHDTPVITLVDSRGLWFSASETMKTMIAEVGGIHIDNATVVHQGSTLATFVTTPRWVLTGNQDRFLGIFPKAGVREDGFERLERLGKVIAKGLETMTEKSPQSLLKGLDAVEVNSRYIILERFGWHIYRIWAKVARYFGEAGNWRRRPTIYLFMISVVVTLPITIAVSMLVRLLFFPLINNRIEGYISRLKSPSGAN